MTADYYAILGVNPAAEDVVIGAAYRALMRHYHPDTNPDPKAQERAREITAAYKVLRDPSSRAEYDAQRGADIDLWDDEDEPRAPPPMRTLGIGLTLLAAAVAGAVYLSPRQDNRPLTAPPPRSGTGHEDTSEPIVPLKPESERLADLDRATAPPPAIPAPQVESPSRIPLTLPEPDPIAVRAIPRKPVAAAPSRPSPSAPKVAGATPPLFSPAPPRKGERVITLDRMSSGFFAQSMANASDEKKTLLVAARDRALAQRKACRSESCVAEAYVRQIRETSAIMEKKTARGPAQD